MTLKVRNLKGNKVTKTDLLEMLNNGENSGVEFCRDTVNDRALAKEIVAFANLMGGRVVLGVDDDGSILGLARDGLEKKVMNVCRDFIRPVIFPYFVILQNVVAGKDVAIIQVAQGWTVHSVWYNNHNRYYIRVGSQSRAASNEELGWISQQRRVFKLEQRGVSGTSANEFDYRRLVDYFHRIRSQETPAIEDTLAWQTLLSNTGFLVEEGDVTPATVAGLLLFSSNPNRFLPQAGVDAVAYFGKEKEDSAKERLSIRGPMTALFGNRGIFENGLVEQSIEFVRRNTKLSVNLSNGARCEEQWTYPEGAVQEVIVNALVHRDYLLSGTNVEISIYSDRLEVVSPGRLPNSITSQRMLTGCRWARNELLKDVMKDYGYIERMGMGIPRKVVKEMLQHNGTLPELIETSESFIVRLWNKFE